jgi:hypothetical protein
MWNSDLDFNNHFENIVKFWNLYRTMEQSPSFLLGKDGNLSIFGCKRSNSSLDVVKLLASCMQKHCANLTSILCPSGGEIIGSLEKLLQLRMLIYRNLPFTRPV